MAIVEMLTPKILGSRTRGYPLKPVRSAQSGPVFHFMIAKLPGAPPRSPTPNVAEAREVITIVPRWNVAGRIEIGSADRGDMSIFGVTFEQFFTKREKAWIGQTIILQDDRAFRLIEDPIESLRHVSPQTNIFVGVSAKDLTRPIHSFDDRPRGGTFRGIGFDVRPRLRLSRTVMGL